MTNLSDKKSSFSAIVLKISVCFLLLLQLFPPLWVQDVTSLRHFLLAITNILFFATITSEYFKKNIRIINPFKFKPVIIFAALIIWMAISITWAINKTESIAVINRWILIFMTTVFLSIILADTRHIFRIFVYCTIFITAVNVLTCIIGYYHFDLHISHRRNLMLNGGYGNKNIFAVCLLLKLPLLYYAVIRYNNVWKIISLLLIASVGFCLVILSTRSTFIGLTAHVLILIIFALTEIFRFKSTPKKILPLFLSVIAVITGFISGNKFIEYNFNKYASKNIQNNYTVSARFKSIEEGNSKGRLIIWKNTLEIIKMKPLFGYGVGNHKLNIMRVEAKKKPNYIVSDHAHNDFLEMQSELGVIGELLYLSLYLSIILFGIKTIFSRKVKYNFRLIALTSILLLITYINDAVFNFPLERATPQIYLALSIALMSFVYYKCYCEYGYMNLHKIIFIITGTMIILTVYTETCHFMSSVLQRKRILCYNSRNKKNIPPSYWVNKAPWLPNIDESTKPIAINNAMMYAMNNDYRSAIYLILADNSNPYYGLKEYRLASYYAHLDMTDSSDYWADKCIKMKPRCYDPVRVKAGNRKKEGNVTAQIQIIKDYLNKEQQDERPWIDLINIYIQQNNYTEAEKTIDSSLTFHENNSSILSKKEEIGTLKCSNNITNK